MGAGRPREVSLPPNEMILLGEQMLKWVKEHNEILHLSEWYSIEKGFLYNEWKTFIQRPEFIPYYERALAIVGKKYLDKDSKVREGVSQRWQRAYFKDLREREDQDAEEQAQRDAKKALRQNEINAYAEENKELQNENMKLKALLKQTVIDGLHNFRQAEPELS